MAVNDIKVPKENAQGTFDEIALIASDLKLGTTANLPVKTGTSGVIEAGAFGTSAGQFAEGNDSRFVVASTTTPAALGTAAVGTGTTFARADHVHAMPTAANVGAAQAVTIIELAPNSTTTITTAQLPARGIAFIEGGGNFTVNLPTPGIRESGLLFSIKTEQEGSETGDVFITVNHAATTLLTSYDLNQAMGSLDWRWDGYRWTYSVTDAVVVPNATYGTNTTLFAVATTEIAINLPGSSGTLALTSLVGASAELVIACSDETTNLTTGTAKVTFRMPYAMTLSSVRASVNTAPTDSTLVVDINEGGSTILSTKLSIDASELTSTTAATAAVISDTALADDAEITIDIDQIGSTIAGKGLKVVLKGVRA
jgi:hypothetical protein